MKKTVALILAFMYLGLTSGLAVNIHYCMGKVSDVQIDSYLETSCKCGSKTEMPCCNHHFQVLKVNDEHQQTSSGFSLKTPELTLNNANNLTALLSLQTVHFETDALYISALFSPPDINTLHSTFRI